MENEKKELSLEERFDQIIVELQEAIRFLESDGEVLDEAKKEPEIEGDAVDTTGDGKKDSVGVNVDVSGNGQSDATVMDTTGDGKVDTVLPDEEGVDGATGASASVTLSPDGSVSAENASAQVSVTPDKTVEINIAEEAEVISEGYSDEELYSILEENDYELTEENLAILKEGLESGDYTIEYDATLTEGLGEALASIGGKVASAFKTGATIVWKGMKYVASSGL